MRDFAVASSWNRFICQMGKEGFRGMIPFYVLTGSFLFFLLMGHAGISFFLGWQHALRASLGVMFALTSSAHWGSRRADLVAMIPPVFPRPALLVTLTGIVELAGAAALQIPKLAPLVAACLFLMLIAIFPANVFAARYRLTISGRPVPSLLPRAAIQVVFLIALWFAAKPI
jgi:uncharacterized membrane protein